MPLVDPASLDKVPYDSIHVEKKIVQENPGGLSLLQGPE